MATDPLLSNTPIVDEQGRPNEYFLRQWLSQGGVNQEVGGLQEQIDALRATVLTAGTGLDGGGDLTTDRTFDLADTAVTPDTYGDETNVAQITIDQQGRITAAQDVAISAGGGGGGVGPAGTVLAFPSGVQSIPSGAFTVLNFNSEDHDDDDWHDNVTNNSRITIPTGVTKVRITGCTAFDFSGSGTTRAARITKNGATATGLPRNDDAASSTIIHAMPLPSAVLDVVAGDYFEIEVFQNTGGNLNTFTTDNHIWFAAEDVTPPGGGTVLAFPSAVQSIPSGAFTVLNFNSEDHDDDDWHDNVTNNSRITVPSGVTKVRITGCTAFDFSGSGTTRAARITKNGATATGLPRNDDAAASTIIHAMPLPSAVLNVVAGDYFEIEVFQNTGGNLNTFITDNHIWFAAEDVTP